MLLPPSLDELIVKDHPDCKRCDNSRNVEAAIKRISILCSWQLQVNSIIKPSTTSEERKTIGWNVTIRSKCGSQRNDNPEPPDFTIIKQQPPYRIKSLNKCQPNFFHTYFLFPLAFYCNDAENRMYMLNNFSYLWEILKPFITNNPKTLFLNLLLL